jgi:ribosomal protein S18 acetylase RimI-like enzyme
MEVGKLHGAVLITLLQAGDLESFDDPLWKEIPPENALELRWGRPHVTWIFTSPHAARRGLASALLDRAAAALMHMGYTELASTFLLGNEPSLLWHWRNGFRLMSYVGSPRRARPKR